MNEAAADSGRSRRLLGGAFLAAVVAFAWLRFSDNVVDNDLWGHVLYGQRVLATGTLERTDSLSWTAAGRPWINHETGAELALGLVHRIAGGPGLWLLMVALAAVTVGWAVRNGAGREPASRWVAVGLLGASVNFIALGYAARPQMFTTLALVALLAILRRFLGGRLSWGTALPPLFAVWVNFHGGFLAGFAALVIAGLAESASLIFPSLTLTLGFAPPPWRPGWVRIASGIAVSALALALNPWGFGLVQWTIQSLALPRPQISEWLPTLPTFGNAPFYLVLFASLAAWVSSRRARRLWEAAVLASFAVISCLHQRHLPLFGLANLMFTPPHLADALDRLAARLPNLCRLAASRRAQLALMAALVVAAGASLDLSVSPPRRHPFTLEVPKDTYPVAAIAFLRAHRLTGNTLTFFDWGQEVLWELPANPVSFDGRLDTVYPLDVMQAHWDLYAGRRLDAALRVDRATVALLPTDSGGVGLLEHAGWRTVYRDPLGTVLVPLAATFPRLAVPPQPVVAGPEAVAGREPFPDTPPALALPGRNR